MDSSMIQWRNANYRDRLPHALSTLGHAHQVVNVLLGQRYTGNVWAFSGLLFGLSWKPKQVGNWIVSHVNRKAVCLTIKEPTLSIYSLMYRRRFYDLFLHSPSCWTLLPLMREKSRTFLSTIWKFCPFIPFPTNLTICFENLFQKLKKKNPEMGIL